MPAAADATAETSQPRRSDGPGHDFLVLNQKVELDVDFASQSLRGKTEITIQPTSRDLKHISLHCRQCTLTRVSVEGRAPSLTYDDPYVSMKLHRLTGIRQHHLLRAKVERAKSLEEEELVISIPRSVQIRELDTTSAAVGDLAGLLNGAGGAVAVKEEADVATENPVSAKRDGPLFAPIRVNIEYTIREFRDGLHFVGVGGGEDSKFPHVYTKNSPFPGNASCLFPCVDKSSYRCEWQISIRCPRTLGDAFRTVDAQGARSAGRQRQSDRREKLTNGVHKTDSSVLGSQNGEYLIDLSEEERALDLVVVCSGDITDEVRRAHLKMCHPLLNVPDFRSEGQHSENSFIRLRKACGAAAYWIRNRAVRAR